MPTNFPAGFDTFNEPSIPEETTLSSSGTGSRNHPEHHRDLGDAIEAMQHAMTLKDHDHSGGTGEFATQKLKQVNTHEEVDTDLANDSIHHTIGPGPHQAAPGNHSHGAPGYQICTSTTRPFNPVEGTMIWETDTHAVRAWSTFFNNIVVTGVNTQDDFTGSFTDAAGRISMNPADWEQWYEDDPGDTDHGAMGYAGGALKWVDEGNDANRCIARRIKVSDKETLTDDMVITWQTGDQTIQETLLFTEAASNDFYVRMSANRQSYIRIQVGNDWLRLLYTTSGISGEQMLGHVEFFNTDTPRTQWRGQLKDREFTIYRLGELITTIKDTKALSAKGAANRGWAVGMMSGDRFLGQTTPANIDWVRIQDLVYYQSANRWTLLNVAAVPVVRLLQSKKQKIIHTGSIIEWGQEVEDNFGFFTLSAPTDIVIKESGIYQIECAIQWDPQWVPDVASASFLKNGVETEYKEQKFMRGNAFTPGFSQTLSVQGKMRFAIGDVLQVKAKYDTSSSLFDRIFSHFDPATKINSRIDIHFMSP